MQNYTIFHKSGVVLHYLATNSATTPYGEQARAVRPDCALCILPNIYEVLSNPLRNYK